VTQNSVTSLKGLALSALAASLMSLGAFGQVGALGQGKTPEDPVSAPIKQEAPKADPTASATGATGLAVDTKSYIIGPEDILLISVWREDTLSHQYGVRPDGKITVPLIKDVQAAGLTPERLGEQLTQALSEYFSKPEITVSVLQINSKKFYISGEIGRPGQYPLVTSIKVFDALNAAGGFKDFANRKNIVIIRGTQRIKFNYDEVLKGKKLEQNIPVENEDTIVVK
jgi:polysaccharide biosynthesis/export protein